MRGAAAWASYFCCSPHTTRTTSSAHPGISLYADQARTIGLERREILPAAQVAASEIPDRLAPPRLGDRRPASPLVTPARFDPSTAAAHGADACAAPCMSRDGV